MPEDIPTNKAIQLQKEGKSNTDIIQSLQGKGYSFQQISEALNQAQAKSTVENAPVQEAAPGELQPSVIYSEENTSKPEAVPTAPPQPSDISMAGEYVSQASAGQPSVYPQPSMGPSTEDIEEITESVIHEKWQKMMEDFGDLLAWKENITNDLAAVKQELMRQENRYENLQSSVIGKVREYDKSVSDVGTEIKAMGKLLSNIIKPLTTNVKELEKLIKQLKK